MGSRYCCIVTDAKAAFTAVGKSISHSLTQQYLLCLLVYKMYDLAGDRHRQAAVLLLRPQP